jgi:hypothetical protein
LAEFWFFGGLAAIFAEVEPARLRNEARFAGKSPSYTSLKSYRPRPSIAAEFERKAAVCIRNTSDCAGEHVNADIYQELLRQHVVPWVQRDVA